MNRSKESEAPIWTAQEVADYVGVTVKAVARYLKAPGFPAPIGGNRRNRRWPKGAVIEYLSTSQPAHEQEPRAVKRTSIQDHEIHFTPRRSK